MTEKNSVVSSAGDELKYKLTHGAGPVVVFLPGYKSDMSGTKATMLAEFCEQNNQACLLFDYSGHGISGGEFLDGTIGRWTRDAIEVIKHAVHHKPVILVGSSMGGWVMLLSAIELKLQVAGMLGIAVAPDFTEDLMWRRFSENQKKQLQDDGVIYLPSEYDEDYPVTYKAIVDGRKNRLLHDRIIIDCPARFIHGMQDEDVPWRTSLKTLDQLRTPDVQLRLLKDGDHRLSSPQQLGFIREMLEELIDLAQ
jgi:pimeloyl-ACP methyl ester carboxylesterase